jgi:hypothetical protein
VIRQDLERAELAIDPSLAYRYSVVAARWEELRLAIDRGNITPGDDRRFHELGIVLRTLTEKIGLPTCRADHHGPEGIPGLTGDDGFPPMDFSYLLTGETWQTAAEGW